MITHLLTPPALTRVYRIPFLNIPSIPQVAGTTIQRLSSTSSFFVPNPLPAAFLRGGTSKGVFINRRYLPASRADWTPIFLRIMGSPDPDHGRQLNGMGGGISSLSKIMVIGPPSSEAAKIGVDAEYTFAQIGIRDDEIDYSGNCGNLSSMVGAFAVDQGICTPRIGSSPTSNGSVGTVRMWNTNTNKEIHTTFPVTADSKPDLNLQQVSIAGVPGKASQILLDFVNPGGARTGKLLPTGNAVDRKTVNHEGSDTTYSLSFVDATNPTVFIASQELFGSQYLPSEDVYSNADSQMLLNKIESIRRAGAEAMGLDPSAKAQPKIAIIGSPQGSSSLPDGHPVDIAMQTMSMGILHRAVPMTVGLCVGVAATIENTVAHRVVAQGRANASGSVDSGRSKQGLLRISHPSGVVDVGAEFGQDGSVIGAKVIRTGRRLMEGHVWW